MTYNDLYIIFIVFVFMIIFVLVGVAFTTLMERKVLGYIQLRKGPNKSGVLGIIQPFSDAIKLFSKEQIYPIMSNMYYYYFSPVFMMFVSMMLWLIYPYYYFYIDFDYTFLYFLCFSSMGVYGIMMAGWSSNSYYSLLGSLRSIAQTVSYEISLSMILISFFVFSLGYKIIDLCKYQYVWFLFLMYPLFIMLLVSLLAETNRSPFDLAEGESELVSGFNVEYSSGMFAMIFLSEYMNIMFMSLLMTILVLGGNCFDFGFFFKFIFFLFSWVWIRGTLPRYRYDKLMNLTWMSYLFVSLKYLFVHFSFISFFLILNF